MLNLILHSSIEKKEYKTYRQQLSILRSRGMKIQKGSQGSKVMRILEQENYYNVINGYKFLFLDMESSGEQYKAGTTFDEVYALYCFDREIRNIYLKYLLMLENSLKTVISHEFSSKYGHDNYLKLDNFQVEASTDEHDLNYIAKRNHLRLPEELDKVQQISVEENTSAVIKLIGDIQQELARQMNKHHQIVTHYMTEYGYIPLWVLVNVLTFGKITIFYRNMKTDDKKKVAKSYSIDSKELHKYMTLLGLARNKCAHDERFYDICFKQSLHTRSIKNFKILGLQQDAKGSYVHGTNDAFAVAVIFARMLSKQDLREFISSMNTAF